MSNNSWHPSLSLSSPSGRLTGILLCLVALGTQAAPIKLVEQAPLEITRADAETILIDFGRVAFANLQLKLPENADQEITVHFGESLKNGRIDRKPPGTVRYNLTTIDPTGKSTVIAEPPADGRNDQLTHSNGRIHPPAILTPKEWGRLYPFRWVEIEGWSGELKPEQIVRRSSFLAAWDDDAASFECSDETLNRIWELCKYSIKATTFAGIYVDGDRERIPYEADAYLNQLSHYYTDNDIEIARDTIDHLLLNGTWPTEWAPHMVFMVYADYMHTGDLGWMAGRYQALKAKTLIDRRTDDGLIESKKADMKRTDIVDWPQKERDNYVFTPRNTVVNAFHLEAIKLMGIMASELGWKDEAKQFAADFAASHEAFQRTFFDTQKDLYRDGIGTDHTALHANLFPVAFNLEPEGRGASISRWMAERGMRCSVYAAQYLMEALFENGQSIAALQLMTADNDRSWKHMVESGTTITWEAWDMKYKPNQDWNHAWGAAPANLLPRYVLGAEPMKPGWELASVKPHPGDLAFAKGKVPTPRGPILIEWENGVSFKLSIELPHGLEAAVSLPAADASRAVFLDGVEVPARRQGSRWILEENMRGSGEFEVR
ncbi:family 78 glycoside hydrolase catalytic domain [Haloferula chungangensis]|uniref:alpha-L-rhamnosidase n=1 Tax=Haloferula chungangensis TaxID=1048331 RepID=A0ABW2L0X6_9BACT